MIPATMWALFAAAAARTSRLRLGPVLFTDIVDSPRACRTGSTALPTTLGFWACYAADETYHKYAILDALEVKPRPTTVGGVDAGMQTIAQLEIVDVGVLIASLRLLEEVRPFRCRDWAHSPKWPQRKHPVARTKDLRESLARLRGAGFVTITAQGGEALIDYGERTIAIANEWGIVLSEEKEPAAV
jgi:hypothetical protein